MQELTSVCTDRPSASGDQMKAVNPMDWHYMRGTPYVVRVGACPRKGYCNDGVISFFDCSSLEENLFKLHVGAVDRLISFGEMCAVNTLNKTAFGQ